MTSSKRRKRSNAPPPSPTQHAPSAAATRTDLGRDAAWLVPLLIALLTIAAYLPALHAGFVSWDDQANFVTNPHYRGFSISNLRWMWSTRLLGHFVPLAWMSLALDYTFWGMNPAGYHAVNVGLHAVNAVLLYVVSRRLLVVANRHSRFDGRDITIAAAFGALFFALHPLRVESVAWITERRDVLSLLFFLSSALSYLRALDREANFRKRYGFSLLLFVCALLSKATAVTLPVALLIMNIVPLRRLSFGARWNRAAAQRVMLELLPFGALSMAMGIVSIFALHTAREITWPEKMAVSAYGLVFYLVKTVLPVRLSPLLELPLTVHPEARVFLMCYAVVIVLALLTWTLRRHWPCVTAAWIAFVLLIFPLLGVVQNGNQIAADRYTYQAGTALALIAAALLLMLSRYRLRLGLAAAGALLLTLGTLTWQQLGVWQNSETLWTRVVAMDSASSIGTNNLGVVLAERGETVRAMELYRRSIASRPGYADPHNNLAFELEQQGKLDEAIEHYDAALAINPVFLDARINLGNALLKLGHMDKAIEQYTAAAEVDPEVAGLQFDWGVTLLREGNPDKAMLHLAHALELDPSFSEARRALDDATRMVRQRSESLRKVPSTTPR